MERKSTTASSSSPLQPTFAAATSIWFADALRRRRDWSLVHEITGEVIECGSGVEFISKGDLVSVPFNIACGRCRNCKERRTDVCSRYRKMLNVSARGGMT